MYRCHSYVKYLLGYISGLIKRSQNGGQEIKLYLVVFPNRKTADVLQLVGIKKGNIYYNQFVAHRSKIDKKRFWTSGGNL